MAVVVVVGAVVCVHDLLEKDPCLHYLGCSDAYDPVAVAGGVGPYRSVASYSLVKDQRDARRYCRRRRLYLWLRLKQVLSYDCSRLWKVD